MQNKTGLESKPCKHTQTWVLPSTGGCLGSQNSASVVKRAQNHLAAQNERTMVVQQSAELIGVGVSVESGGLCSKEMEEPDGLRVAQVCSCCTRYYLT
jgi:hypothetical protein